MCADVVNFYWLQCMVLPRTQCSARNMVVIDRRKDWEGNMLILKSIQEYGLFRV